ncbi:hypothetical protein [Streptomyces triculaminicus]|uniref:hypothetical protein n=1 Tax=Streptomyces triculaminicus TaxID=2816232 RepID=UPI0037CF5583
MIIRTADALRDGYEISTDPGRLKRVLLSTLDAHEVYARVGFAPVADPGKLMMNFSDA